ncbi:DUF2382 domain-containing protein [Thermomonospora umbrina]|uniref:Uncharacterized protein (TIGR02271 family) n=1 Tax=Thermomonospora umbrina TaxID=111806 RepID=A0A3D9T4T1_9ACTN|nr:PRC and DUF2382 domain-containing protein [Thermomonospora umbrina]REE99704.1 uncharacterized protein (TIGR02271 family) [Thermomonospora umbrina]
MITEKQIPNVLDHPLYDVNGSKVGDVKNIFLDDATGLPEWLCVKTGLFGNRETFVPTGNAELISDHVEVTFDKEVIKQAPHVDVDPQGHLSAEEEEQLYNYYGIEWDPGRRHGTAQSGQGRSGRADAAASSQQTGTQGRAAAAPQATVTGRQARTDTAGGRERRPDAGGRAEGARPTDDAMTRSEERLRVGKETRESGRARLHKYVVTEQQQTTVPVSHEEVRLEREPITDQNRDAATSGPSISEADHEIVLHEERAVVSKETVPIERVRATKETVTEQQTVSDEVRKERIELEGDTGRPGGPEKGGPADRGGRHRRQG